MPLLPHQVSDDSSSCRRNDGLSPPFLVRTGRIGNDRFQAYPSHAANKADPHQEQNHILEDANGRLAPLLVRFDRDWVVMTHRRRVEVDDTHRPMNSVCIVLVSGSTNPNFKPLLLPSWAAKNNCKAVLMISFCSCDF